MSEQIPEDDYALSPCGHLGSKTGVSQYGKFLGEFSSNDDALKFIKTHMEEERFWPGIWWISDHGNAWQIDIEGNEILNDEDQQGCPYCGGDCQDDEDNACDGYLGDIDELCDDEEE